jgi:ABC-type multidrug transport system ATPase subunit
VWQPWVDRRRADLHSSLILAAVEAVTAIGLVKRFEGTTAVDELDLVVAPGQVHGLLGANGAGKTRCCACCSG